MDRWTLFKMQDKLHLTVRTFAYSFSGLEPLLKQIPGQWFSFFLFLWGFLLQNVSTSHWCLFTSLCCNIWIQWKHVGKEKVRNTVSLFCIERIHNPIYVWTVEAGELGWASWTLAELELLELWITSKLAGTQRRSHSLVPDQGAACALLIIPENKTSECND